MKGTVRRKETGNTVRVKWREIEKTVRVKKRKIKNLLCAPR